MIATEMCTVGPTDRAAKVSNFAFLKSYVYDFQHGMLIFFQKNTVITLEVLYGGRCAVKSMVPKTERSEKFFKISVSSLKIDEGKLL
jgi:hypothetical protein